MLHDKSGLTSTVVGLEPYKFLTIATPHLGVRNFTYFDDCGLPAPDLLKVIASKVSCHIVVSEANIPIRELTILSQRFSTNPDMISLMLEKSRLFTEWQLRLNSWLL